MGENEATTNPLLAAKESAAKAIVDRIAELRAAQLELKRGYQVAMDAADSELKALGAKRVRKPKSEKKGPGRPAHNSHPQTCSGAPIPMNEVKAREK